MTDQPSGFDFQAPVERRGTSSSKWDRYTDPDVIPLWVADMDFAVAPSIVQALEQRIRHPVFGYTRTPDSLVDAATRWLQQDFGWRVAPEWMVWLPGVVGGFNMACRACGQTGDEVLMHVPVYYPFRSAPGNADRTAVEVPLVLEGGRWQMDLDATEAAVTERTRTFLLCNPQNPTGRAYTADELAALAALCARHDIVLCSDEIHCGLVLDDVPHVPVASLDPEIAARTITLLAPSKTYNTPGLGCSFAVIPDRDLRRAFQRARVGLVPGIGPLEYAAAEAAFREDGTWLAQLGIALRENRDRIEQRIAALPGVRMTHVEATYLAWIDVGELGLEDPPAWFEAHGLGFSPGNQFGDAHFIRWNFATTRARNDEALDRFEAAVRARN